MSEKDIVKRLRNFGGTLADQAAAEIERLRGEVESEQAWRFATTERMQAIGEKFGCEPGSNRLDWIESQLTAAHARASEMREACAKVCDDFAAEQGRCVDERKSDGFTRVAFAMADGAIQCASAIRALTLPSGGGGDDHREAGSTDRSGGD